jgi:hypothetical protein
MNLRPKWLIIVMLVALAATVVVAQRRFRGQTSSRGEVPEWSNEPGFEKDTFVFTRIEYNSGYGRGWGRGGWATDYRDADLNFSFRLQQLTSLKVDPEGKFLRLTDPDLFNHPFIYIVEPGRMELDQDEVKALRRYLLSGGFLMVDDFWGEAEYENLYDQMKQVFPDREPRELDLTHQIFHCVFDLKEKPQIPNYELGESSQWNGGITWERPDARTPHYRAIFDDKDRMMVIICHNTDNGDGWEREGVYEYYFREFSEKKAYPLGINIVFYAMTH